VKAVPIRPLDPKVLLDEGGTVAVHGFREFDGFPFAVLLGPQSLDLLFERRVDEDVKGIGTVWR
jgi:hypothetical protein